MRKRLTEETILFLSVVKWVVLASVIGFFVGCTTTLFVKGLEWSQFLRQLHPLYFWGLPITLLVTAWLGYEYLPSSDAHSTNTVIEVIHNAKSISITSVLKAFALPILTIASGGSVAIELFGPAIAPYATVACIISFLMTGHRSIYSAQILSMKKSSTLRVQHGESMDRVEAAYQARGKTLSNAAAKCFNKMTKRKNM